MKVKLQIDPAQKEPVVTICAPQLDEKIAQLYKTLQQDQHPLAQIEADRNGISYYLNLSEVLFFETDSKLVMAHTADKAYRVKYKLYELEDLLGHNFMRISKSTIINLDKIWALTRSISNCRIQFEHSYKTVYTSRRYYRNLCARLDERRSRL